MHQKNVASAKLQLRSLAASHMEETVNLWFSTTIRGKQAARNTSPAGDTFVGLVEEMGTLSSKHLIPVKYMNTRYSCNFTTSLAGMEASLGVYITNTRIFFELAATNFEPRSNQQCDFFCGACRSVRLCQIIYIYIFECHIIYIYIYIYTLYIIQMLASLFDFCYFAYHPCSDVHLFLHGTSWYLPMSCWGDPGPPLGGPGTMWSTALTMNGVLQRGRLGGGGEADSMYMRWCIVCEWAVLYLNGLQWFSDVVCF